MILEEETYRKFGYYLADLPPHSTKEVVCVCDDCGKNIYRTWDHARRSKHHFCDTGGCYAKWLSRERRGDKSPLYRKLKVICNNCGKTIERSPSNIKQHNFCNRKCKGEWLTKNKQRENSPSWKGGLVTIKCLFCDKEKEVRPDQIRKGWGKFCSPSCNRKAQRMPRHHTKPELIFEEICKKNNLPFQFVGDGQLWIGKRKKLNPDFIEANGKKICIEIMGDYWHSPLLNRTMKEIGTLEFRKKHYRRFKWIPVFIWTADLDRKDAEAFVLNKLQNEGAIK